MALLGLEGALKHYYYIYVEPSMHTPCCVRAYCHASQCSVTTSWLQGLQNV
jgi:hypothetical protein